MPSPRGPALLLLGLLAAAMPAAPAHAADRAWADCAQVRDRDLGIAGCTAVLRRGSRETAANRAIAYRNRGLDHAAKGDRDRAIADFGEAIRLNPKYADAFYSRAYSFHAGGEYDRAVADYSQAIRLKPDYAAAYYSRGSSYQAKGDHDRAIADYGQAIRLNPSDPDGFHARALSYEKKGDLDRAIADYGEAARLNPRNAAYYYGRGGAYYVKNDYDRAIADFGEAIRLDPNDPDAFIGRGNAYNEKGDRDRALADYDEAIRLKPQYAMAFHNRGVVFERKGDIDRAIADYSHAIRLKPDYADAFRSRSTAYNGKAEHGQAIADADEAIRLEPENAQSWRIRASAYYAKQDFRRAITDYDAAIRLDPADGPAFNGRGSAYFKLGDYRMAQLDLNEAVRLLPKDAVTWANRCEVRAMVGDLDEALRDCDQALRLDPGRPAPHAYRGFALMKKGDLDGALRSADEAVRLNPRHAEALGYRGEVHLARGEAAEALADYAAALELDASLRQFRPGQERARSLMGTALAQRPTPGQRPTVRILSPRDGAEIRDPYVTVEYELSSPAGLPVDAVEVLLDGRPVRGLTRMDAAAGGPRVEREIVSVPQRDVELGLVPRSGSLAGEAARVRLRWAARDPVSAIRAAPALGETRVALVIGNSDYANVGRLPNPVGDAQSVARSLRQAGFKTVTVLGDAGYLQLNQALRRFSDEAETADWAVVYYAGHGIEVGGTNYLVPVDARLRKDTDAEFEAVPLTQVLTAVRSARKLRLVILDACRDNPFAAQMRRTVAVRAVTRGLARVEPTGATLVAYAAKEGEVALDGEGQGSPFVLSLVKRLDEPGLEINKLFRLVRNDVLIATGGKQEPFVYGSLPPDDFYFRPPQAN